VFSASDYKLVHTEWGLDPLTNLSYPTQSVFTAERDDVQIHIVMNVQKTVPLSAGPPPALVIFEQPTHFTGEITINRHWLPIKIPFEGNGFKEYTATSVAVP
jgi:hypothetical protein